MKLLHNVTMILVLTVSSAFATSDAPTDLAAKLKAAEQELRLAKLENLVRREEGITQQLEKVRSDQQSLFKETCVAAGIDPDPKVCAIDLNKGTVTKQSATPPTGVAK
jgi:hypothetical protein